MGEAWMGHRLTWSRLLTVGYSLKSGYISYYETKHVL
jgi:hypothetical protein